MRFTLRQLEYFIATAEAGSITLASERIHVSQPSISTAISQLEIELNTQLFLRRHAQGLSLTPAGQKILAQAKAVIEQGQNLYIAASEASDQVRGTLSLGCLLTFAPMLLPEVSHSFKAAFPGVQVRPTVADHSVLLAKLERAEIDVALSYDLLVPDGFEFTALAELPPYVQVAETDPLAAHSAITLKELEEREFILLDLPLSRDYFLGLFAAAGATPNIAAQIQHQEVIRTMVGNRYGYTLANVRPKNKAALDGRRLVGLRLAGEHKPMRIGLIRVGQQVSTRMVRSFEDHCKSLISNSYVPGMEAPIMNMRRSTPS
ncbi:LysR family transcriptional regulator [Pararhizobium polonicum]|uniref:HTH-type transcriptional regulator TtuA n=1 Tax=Pararhizobium polonicum TaxID=1612624 RepID=A0A1C7P3R1_9HYPH|nr:LysR family transcriptional regulator [Pararhizobium polonicum]OBZ95847.1 LysR family transcriptional regulator [Pararhizobium polonicum]